LHDHWSREGSEFSTRKDLDKLRRTRHDFSGNRRRDFAIPGSDRRNMQRLRRAETTIWLVGRTDSRGLPTRTIDYRAVHAQQLDKSTRKRTLGRDLEVTGFIEMYRDSSHSGHKTAGYTNIRITDSMNNERPVSL